jgi:glycosyltransferase involved in cell wall biosynthesis
MKVLALASYPIEAAATRYRLEQFVAPLAERGISLTVHPFLDSKLFEQLYRPEVITRTAIRLVAAAVLRFKEVWEAKSADVVLIQREAMMFGPPLIEWLVTRVTKCPMVLDLDDATYVSYTSPTYGRIGKAVKWFSKTDDLIHWATLVTCGNDAIAEYVASKGAVARVIPTVVDTDKFRPVVRKSEEPVLGWIGTHSTFPYLESIFPVLQELATSHRLRLKVVGGGKEQISIPSVEVENLPWNLEREVSDFQSIDIGLYPIDDRLYSNKWASGKSGFKAIQYMAVGIPYVATPVGAVKGIGQVGATHFCAVSTDEWRNYLDLLLTNRDKREQMGAAGRRYICENYSLPAQADKLADALFEAGRKGSGH